MCFGRVGRSRTGSQTRTLSSAPLCIDRETIVHPFLRSAGEPLKTRVEDGGVLSPDPYNKTTRLAAKSCVCQIQAQGKNADWCAILGTFYISEVWWDLEIRFKFIARACVSTMLNECMKNLAFRHWTYFEGFFTIDHVFAKPAFSHTGHHPVHQSPSTWNLSQFWSCILPSSHPGPNPYAETGHFSPKNASQTTADHTFSGLKNGTEDTRRVAIVCRNKF